MQADTKLCTSSTPCTSWLGMGQHFYLNKAFPHGFFNLLRTNFSPSADLIGYYLLTCILSLVRSGVTANTSEPPIYQPKGVHQHQQRSAWISRWRIHLTSTTSSIGPMIRAPRMQGLRMGERFFFYWLTRGHSILQLSRQLTLEIPLGSANLRRAQFQAESIPDYSADSANEDTHAVTAAPMTLQDDANTPNSDQESLSISTAKNCACMVCLEIGVVDEKSPGDTPCHFNCGWLYSEYYDNDYWTRPNYQAQRMAWIAKNRAAHEKTHCRQDPQISRSPFSCAVGNCRFSSKRWSDLIRHTTARHCKSPSKFVCSVIGCKYHGEGNGFTRKDKLTEHYRSMHQGQKVPGQAGRAIKPAPAAFHANAQGSSSSGVCGA